MTSEPLPAPDGDEPAGTPARRDRVAGHVRRHQRAVFAYLGSLGCPRGLVEDLAQDTFVAALRTGFEERDEASTRAWLRTVARNRYLDHVRSSGRSPSVDLDEVDAAWRRFEGEDGGAAYHEALRTCLAGLEAREKRALELRYGEEGDRARIAAAIGLSVGGLKALLARARARLRTCIERRLA